MQRLDMQRSAAKSKQIPLDLSSEHWCGAQSSVRKPDCIETPPELWQREASVRSHTSSQEGEILAVSEQNRTLQMGRLRARELEGMDFPDRDKIRAQVQVWIQFWIFVSGAVRLPPNPLLHSASRWLLPTATGDPHLRTLWLQKHTPLCTGQTRSVKSAWDQELM